MIKVMIVEDEPPIARMLEKMITGMDCEMEIVGTARNGREGLEILRKKMPDVIFTDIKMPVMDGLTFIQEARKINEGAEFVILSGYQEFDYARRAVRLNVTDYLLKPISEEKLKDILEKLKESIVELKIKNREHLLGKLYDKNRIINAEIQSGNCMVGIMCFGSLPAAEDENMFPGSLLWGKLNMDQQVEQLLRQLGYHGTFWQIPGVTSVEHILIYEDDTINNEEKKNLMHQIYNTAFQNTDMTLTMICRTTGVDLSSIGTAHMQLRKELHNRILFGNSQFLEQGSQEFIYDKEIKDSLLLFCEACSGTDSELVEQRKKKFFELCKLHPIRQTKFVRYLERLVSYGCEFYRLPLEEQEQIQIPVMVSDHYDISEIEKEVNSIFSEISENIKIKVRHPVLVQVKQFIEENRRTQLTNEKIARKFGFATAYLGRIFKETYGITMGDYLVQLKIAEAKQIMRQNPDMLLKEVAAMVGYPDQYYFSKVFKKKTGVWPSQYNKKQV
ncbi:MAG: response regulator [Eubacteriales bacterium]|nr:response regulator [Eubacteriales bacterium]